MASGTTRQDTRHDTSRNPNSRELQDEIARTRRDMDETLEELGERLHPKHLLDHVIDYFRSGSRVSSREAKEQVTAVSRQVARQLKEHPIPYALMAAGMVWWMLEDDSDESDRDDWVYRRRPADASAEGSEASQWRAAYGEQWQTDPLPWESGYDWSTSAQTQESWNAKAKAQLASLQTVLADASKSSAEKLRHSAESVLRVSGRKRREIHAQWADLPEHSGSSVDARTGEPYDESYGEQWRHLAASDYFADYDPEDMQRESWIDQARDIVEQIRASASAGGENVQDTFRTIAGKIGDFAARVGAVSRSSGRTWGGRARRAGAGVSHGVQRLAGSTSAGMARFAGGAQSLAVRSQEQMARGYYASRRQLGEAVVDYPVAAGAAALGLGLLAGFLLPHSRAEDRWMGEKSDEFKEHARGLATEARQRGEQVVAATAESAMDEARHQGLTPDTLKAQAQQTVAKTAEQVERKLEQGASELAEKAKKVTQRAQQTAKEETQRQREERS